MINSILLIILFSTVNSCNLNRSDLSKNDLFCAIYIYETIENNTNKRSTYAHLYRRLKRENQTLVWDDPKFYEKMNQIEVEIPNSDRVNYNLVSMAGSVGHKYYGDAADDLIALSRETTLYKSCVSYLDNFDTRCKQCLNPARQFQWNVYNYMNMANGVVDFSKFNKENYNFLYYKD